MKKKRYDQRIAVCSCGRTMDHSTRRKDKSGNVHRKYQYLICGTVYRTIEVPESRLVIVLEDQFKDLLDLVENDKRIDGITDFVLEDPIHVDAA